jgi:hypothetical protein
VVEVRAWHGSTVGGMPAARTVGGPGTRRSRAPTTRPRATAPDQSRGPYAASREVGYWSALGLLRVAVAARFGGAGISTRSAGVDDSPSCNRIASSAKQLIEQA